jgi:hypothetical protein
MDIFKLYRDFWDYSFANPEKIKPTHIAIFSFCIEHCNRLGWKLKFGFPTSMVMEATGIKSYSVYKKHFDDLVEYGFIEVIEYSKNQYSSNIIALKENDKALNKALDKAFIKHLTKQSESTQQSISSIDKQITSKQLNKEQIKQLDFILNESNEIVNCFLKWIDYKNERGEYYKEKSLSTVFKKIKTLSNNNPLIANEIIDNSIVGNWSGLFALNKSQTNQPNQPLQNVSPPSQYKRHEI